MGFEHLPAQAQKEGLVLPQAGRKGSPQCSEVAGKPQPWALSAWTADTASLIEVLFHGIVWEGLHASAGCTHAGIRKLYIVRVGCAILFPVFQASSQSALLRCLV